VVSTWSEKNNGRFSTRRGKKEKSSLRIYTSLTGRGNASGYIGRKKKRGRPAEMLGGFATQSFEPANAEEKRPRPSGYFLPGGEKEGRDLLPFPS